MAGFFFEVFMPPLIVTAAIIESQGRLLLTRRRMDVPYPDYWEFPGGKLESGEDPVDCVVREIREELGIEISVRRICDVLYHRYPERTVLVLAYWCDWIGGEIADLEVAGHAWVTPAGLAEFRLLPADLPLADRLAKGDNEDLARL